MDQIAIAARGNILILQQVAHPSREQARAGSPHPFDFAQTPYCANPVRGARSRLVDEAEDWAACRAQRMRLEEQLSLQEEFRLVREDAAEAIRERLATIERRFGDLPIEGLLEELASVQRELHADDDEREWC